MDGKATLQEICGWVSDNFDWYRYNEGSGWDVSWGLLSNLHRYSFHLLEFYTTQFVIQQSVQEA
jgi:hypothetical protein